MYLPRTIHVLPQTGDDIKRYSIAADGKPFDSTEFELRLKALVEAKPIEQAAFVIFHRGESLDYLVLCWWGNDNELFTSVSVREEEVWVEDSARYSFCLYDMEVMWAERNFYIQTIDCEQPSLAAYRDLYFQQT